MKKNKLLSLGIAFFGVGVVATCLVSTFAWFTTAKSVEPSFDGSFVQYYFDEESGDGKSSANALMITKPVHLYNLSRLYKRGTFTGAGTYYFQLGKETSSGSGVYRFYANVNDDETSLTNLSSTSLDMSHYLPANGLTVTPIGQDFGTDTTDYSFNDHFIGNGLTITDLYIDGTDSTFNHIGFFGDVSDSADIYTFNFDRLTINSTKTDTTATPIVGLVAGYLNATTASSITLKQVSVRDGQIEGNCQSTSKYALIGSGTSAADPDLESGFGGNSGDTGVLNFTEIANNRVASYNDLFTSYDATYGWMAENGYYVSKDTDNTNGLGIFSFSTASSGGYQSFITDKSHFSSQSGNTLSDSILSVVDRRTNSTSSTVTSVDLTAKASYSTDSFEYEVCNAVKDKSNNDITSLTSFVCQFSKSAKATLTQYGDSTKTKATQSNALFFTTTKDDQDLFFVAWRRNDFKNTTGNSEAKIQLYKIDSNGYTTGDPLAQGYYGPTNCAYPNDEGGLKGTFFRTGTAGDYAIITQSQGTAYAYIRANGVSGGDFGGDDLSTAGVSVDFSATSANFRPTS